MLSNHEAAATVAVHDIDRAVQFYEETLGLARIHSEGREAFAYQTGKSTLLVYRSEFAGTNRATAVTWSVHVSGRMRVAWFKDPDGNIHALIND